LHSDKRKGERKFPFFFYLEYVYAHCTKTAMNLPDILFKKMCIHILTNVYAHDKIVSSKTTTHQTKGVNKMKKDINTIMKELAEMTAMLEETSAIVESLKDEVKAYMTEQGVDEVVTENGEKATWREVISSRFDSTAFKKSEWGELYKEYCKPTKSKRFTFNA